MTTVNLETARQARGLRLVVLASVPSAWAEAAKAILHVKGLPALVHRCELRAPAVRAWTGVHNNPVLMHDDDPPRSHWSEILALAERLAPGPALLPADRGLRLRVLGLAHEIVSEGGLLWAGRLLMIDLSLTSEGQRGFSVPVARYLAGKYGYAPERVPAARRRVEEVLAALAGDLRRSRAAGSDYVIGPTLTAADLYAATALSPFALLPDDLCPLPPGMREVFSALSDHLRPLVPPELIAHRDLVYRRHLELPMVL